MKKFKKFLLLGGILLSLLLSCLPSSAQVIRFNTTSYTSNVLRGGRWSGWREPVSSDMLLTIDLDLGIVTIYSPKTQVYRLLEYEGMRTDRDGDTTMSFLVVDQDGDRGGLRLMERRNGRNEVYIDFADVHWCYSVIRL